MFHSPQLERIITSGSYTRVHVCQFWRDHWLGDHELQQCCTGCCCVQHLSAWTLTSCAVPQIGVAMSNGSDGLKEVATWVAPSNDDDGFAAAINKLLQDGF